VTVTVDPILVSLGPLAIRWYGVVALAGLGLAVWLSLRELRRTSLDARLALAGLAWALPAGLIGARLAQVLGDWGYYLTSPAELWQLNLNSLALWGGLAAGGLVFAARVGRGGAARRRRILDVVAPYALLGIAIGRLGEFLDGQGQGLASLAPWATQYTNRLAATPDFGVSRHPAQLYDALVAFGLFAALSLAPRRLPDGSRVALALIAYGAVRVALGAVRLDPAFAFGLQIEQVLALAGMLVGAVFGLRPLLERGLAAQRAAPGGAAAEQAATPGDSLAA
jgi:phosphatidylglycerol---prolipoprotein diacylglyceryl transferase